MFHFTGRLTRLAHGVSSISDAGGSSTNYIIVVLDLHDVQL